MPNGNDPLFLTVQEVDTLHDDQIRTYGGTMGTRDPDALDAAVHMPQQTFGGTYVHADIFEMAAAYLFHIVLGHPYVDGNKRTGAEAADVFLSMNGYELEATEDELELVVIDVATHVRTKQELAGFLRGRSVSR